VNRNRRLKFAFEGELAGALEWEAARRKLAVQELAEQLLQTTCAELIAAWREGRRREATVKESGAARRPTVETVLKMSYGPSLAAARGRRRFTSDSSR